jgi:hypothetical protein
MIKIDENTRKVLLDLYEKRQISLEGNILKLIESEDDEEFSEYVSNAIKRDKEKQRQRLSITKKIQQQNNELTKAQEENIKIQEELKTALQSAETAKENALVDLDVLQKKTQFELIQVIVKTSLYIIIGVGASVTALYAFALIADKDTQVIGSTWSNMFGILLTNAFSIIGTIMGVKYASKKDCV